MLKSIGQAIALAVVVTALCPSVALTAAPPGARATTSRIVKCQIFSKGPGMDGPCRFTPMKGGSFILTSDSGYLIPEAKVREVKVVITAQDHANIVGLGIPGKPDRAVRDRTDRGCWVSNTGNITVCAK